MPLDPALRIPLVDPRGNINPNEDSISIADLAALLGVGVTVSGGAPAAQAWVCPPYQGQGTISAPTQWPGDGYLVGGATMTQTVFVHFGSSVSLSVVDAATEMKYIHVFPSATSKDEWIFRPTSLAGILPINLDFAPAFPPQAGATAGPIPLAWSIEARMRKVLAGDGTAARQHFGFNCFLNVNTGAQVAQVGLFGDGLGGFQFGSLNCPDGGAVAVQNGATDIDPGSASQPADLVAPGTGEFYVRIKAVPAGPNNTAAIGCYLNDVLITTLLAPFWPRSAGGGTAGFPLPYTGFTPTFGVYPNPDGVTADPGFYLRDLRVSYEQDLTL